MDNVLLISTILTLVFAVLLIIAIKEDWPAIGTICIIGLLFTGFLGFGIVAINDTKTTKEFPVECTYSKNPIEVVVYTKDGNREFFTAKADYDAINDSTRFYYKVEYNHYGSELRRELKFK